MKKGVKLMQRTVFGFNVINVISGQMFIISTYCRTRSHRKDINLFHRTMDLPKLFIGMLNDLFVLYFFMDKYSNTLKEFSTFSFLKDNRPDFYLKTYQWQHYKSLSIIAMAKLDFGNVTKLFRLSSCRPMGI